MDFPDKPPILEYTHALRSRYGETDRMGYVYYGRYLEFFEVARTEMIRSQGVSYKEMEDSGIMLPVIHAELDYKIPIIYDEEMLVKVMLFDVPSVRLETYYEIRTAESDTVHVYGEVSLCFMDKETRKPLRAPKSFIESIKKT